MTASPIFPGAKAAARNEFIDYAKGILILLVVFGHAVQEVVYRDFGMFGNPVFKALYIFHMPLFMALAGYVSHHSIGRIPWQRFVARRAVNLLLPIFSWSALTFVVILAAKQTGRMLTTPADFFALFFTSLWFLWALFQASAVAAFAKKFRCDNLWFAVVSTAVIYWLVPESGRLYLSKFTYPFFWIGYLLAKNPAAWQRLAANRILPPGLLLFTVAIYYCWTDDTFVYLSRMVISAANVKIILLRFVGGVVVSALALWLFYKLFSVRFMPSFIWLGVRSLYVFILQNYFFICIHVWTGEGAAVPANGMRLTLTVAPVIALAVCWGFAWASNLVDRFAWLALVFFGRPGPSNLPRR